MLAYTSCQKHSSPSTIEAQSCNFLLDSDNCRDVWVTTVLLVDVLVNEYGCPKREKVPQWIWNWSFFEIQAQDGYRADVF